jgi:hypothetical protein
MMCRLSFWQRRRRLPTWTVPVLLLLTTLHANGSSNSASAPSIAINEKIIVDGIHRQKSDVLGPVASICSRGSETLNGDTHPAMAYVYAKNGVRRKKCSSPSSKFRLDFPIQEENTSVTFAVFQKDCHKTFPRGEEALRKGRVTVSPTMKTASIEFFAAQGVVGVPLVEFCLEATMSQMTKSGLSRQLIPPIRMETNVSAKISYRATRLRNRGRPEKHSAVYVVVENIALEEPAPGAPKPLASSSPTTPSPSPASASDVDRRGFQTGNDEL